MRTVFNLAIFLAIFGGRLPAGAEIATNAPLPSMEDILPHVLKKADTEDDNGRKFNQRYHFERTRVTEVRNSDGEIKKRKEKIKTNDGRRPEATPPVPASESSQSATNANPSDTDSSPKSNSEVKTLKKSDFPITGDMLARFEFTVVGHEELNSRLALVVDFKPVKGKKPERNIKDKFINKAAGRLWIDMEDYAIVRASLFLIDRVSVIGGLAGSVAKFTCDMQRERTPDGLWFMRQSSWHLEGREFVFPLIMDFHEELRDLRPLTF